MSVPAAQHVGSMTPSVVLLQKICQSQAIQSLPPGDP